jgi:hypothetical protein
MSDEISLLLSIQDSTLRQALEKLITEDKLLSFLSDNPQNALEFITITDQSDYDKKENEVVIFAGDSDNESFTCCPPEAGHLKSAARRAYCHRETVNMNKAACNSVQEHGGSLENLAQEISWKTRNFKKLTETRLAIADQLPVAIAVVDESSVVSFLNKEAQILFQGQDFSLWESQ